MIDAHSQPAGSPVVRLGLIASQLTEVIDQISVEGYVRETVRSASYLQIARYIISERQAATRLSAHDIFTNGPWNMVLDLYEKAWLQKSVSVTSLTIASGIPQTTALRYIALLERASLLARCDDHSDGRRVFLTLTRRGFDQVTDYLTASARAWGIEIYDVPPPEAFA
jgi:DNA-binding MarR family transcriptional regulator